MMAPVPNPVRKLLRAVCALLMLPEFNAEPISVNKLVKSLVMLDELVEPLDDELLVELLVELESVELEPLDELEGLIPRSDANWV